MDRGRFKKKKDDKAWLDWLSDDVPADISDMASADDSFPVDPSRRSPEPLALQSPEPEAPIPTRRPKELKPIPVVPEAPPERRPIFGSSAEAPSFARRRQEPEPRTTRPIRTSMSPVSPPVPIAAPVMPQKTMSTMPVQQPEKPRHAFKQQPAARHAVTKTATTKTKAGTAAAPPVGVSIQINMPAFHKPEFTRSKAAWAAFKPHITRARIIKTAVPVVVIALLWGGLVMNKHRLDNKHAAATAAEATGNPDVASTKVPFTPIVPATNAKLGIADNTHSRYDATKKTYSFVDTLDGKQITVSQQMLPVNGSTASDIVATAAKSLNASSNFKTGYGTAYIFNSQKYGYQSLVFSIRDRLLFANSSAAITNDDWTDYINALN